MTVSCHIKSVKEFLFGIDKRIKLVYNKDTIEYLIESDGGTGPMKSGNLLVIVRC